MGVFNQDPENSLDHLDINFNFKLRIELDIKRCVSKLQREFLNHTAKHFSEVPPVFGQ